MSGLCLCSITQTYRIFAGIYLSVTLRGGKKNNVLADFFIGAHAAVLGCPY